jgi:hypothetical protein
VREAFARFAVSGHSPTERSLQASQRLCEAFFGADVLSQLTEELRLVTEVNSENPSPSRKVVAEHGGIHVLVGCATDVAHQG